MRILFLDTGSKYLDACLAALHGHEVYVLGYPNVPEIIRNALPLYERVVFAGDQFPLGIDIPYEKDLMKVLRDISVPVLGIGRGAAVFLESRGAKIRASGGEYQLKKVPEGWSHDDSAWHNRKGDVALLSVNVEAAVAAIKKFVHL